MSSTALKHELTASEDISSQKSREMDQFTAVLAQLNHENIASLVSSIRQDNETRDNADPLAPPLAQWHRCKVVSDPLHGSYNLAYHVRFEDGVDWLLKVPANGHHACFDHLAAETLKSEALTMKMIKQTTDVPIPKVHHFDTSYKNDIGCPYLLMDFLKGKPLWEGWFEEGCSRTTREQFRARSLQTIAAAMVQLSQFTLDRGGSLRFDCNGRPVDVAAARVPDWLAEQDIMQGLRAVGDGLLYCEKGPISDPASAFLFMLSRRGVKNEDGSYVRGVQEIVRLFTEWTLEKTENVPDSSRRFVLAHPDFAVQNFLVEDDGTLCGIIDWDGVAAVPLSVGCLKYPDWLMSDWHPEYNYCPGVAGQQENSRQELATYRTMYAQFVEVFSTIACGSSQVGKSYADITRRSLIAGSLDTGAQDLKLTSGMLDTIFHQIESLNDDHSDVSDSILESSFATGTDDIKEGDRNGESAPNETADDFRVEQEDNNAEDLCSKSKSELATHQIPLINTDVMSEEKKFPQMHATLSGDPDFEKKHNIACASNDNIAEDVVRDLEASASCKIRVAKWALGLGQKASLKLVKALHKEETTESEPPRRVRVLKWALDVGAKGCKAASEALYKEEGKFSEQLKDNSQSQVVRNDALPTSRSLNASTDLCKRTEVSQRKVPYPVHPDRVPDKRISESHQTKTKRFHSFLLWLIAVLKKMIHKPPQNKLSGILSPAAAERQLATLGKVDAEHCQKRNPCGHDRGRENSSDRMQSAEMGSEDVWASIAAEIDKSGISIDMIKKRHDIIVQCIIQTLDTEISQETKTVSHSENRKAAKEEGQARTIKNTNNKSTPRSVSHLATLESKLSRANPEDGACSGPTTVPEGTDSDVVGPNSYRPHNGESEPQESESQIFRLDDAKRRLDVEEAPKMLTHEFITPHIQDFGAVVPHFRRPNSKASARGIATHHANGEADRQLLIDLSSPGGPRVLRTPSSPKHFRVAGDKRVAIEQGKHTKAKTLENAHEPLEAIGQKLRMMAPTREVSEAENAHSQQYELRVAEGKDGGYKSREDPLVSSVRPNLHEIPIISTAKPPTIFKGGWWFETSEGILMRIEKAESLHGNSNDEAPISRTNRYVSKEKASSSITSSKSADDAEAVKTSHLQLRTPNPIECDANNVFRVPEIDDDVEEYDTNSLEDCEIDQGAPNPAESEPACEGGGPTCQKVGKAEVEEMTDSGHFNPIDICIALGNGNLDEKRMKRLKGFMALFDDAVGRYRR